MNRFVDDILTGQRPWRFEATPEEAEAIWGALKLGAADVSAGLLDPDFVRRLEHRILAEAGEAPAPPPRMTRRALLTDAGTGVCRVRWGARRRACISGTSARGLPSYLGNWVNAAANRVYRLPKAGYFASMTSTTSRGVLELATVWSKSSM